MNSLALKLSSAIKRANPEETASVEVMQYALNIILNTLLILLCSTVTGWLIGNLAATLLFFASFSLLRVCSGGFHLRTAAACNVVTTLLCVLVPYFISYAGTSLMLLNGLSLAVMLFFAPNPDKNAHLPLSWYPALKIASIAMVSLNFLIGSSVLGVAFFVQSLTVIPWRRRS